MHRYGSYGTDDGADVDDGNDGRSVVDDNLFPDRPKPLLRTYVCTYIRRKNARERTTIQSIPYDEESCMVMKLLPVSRRYAKSKRF